MYKETQRGSSSALYTKRASFRYSPFSHISCMHLFTPNFPWVLHSSQEKSKTMVLQNFGKLTRCVHGPSEDGDL